MSENRIKISLVASNQLPEFVNNEFPLASQFLEQYYKSSDSQGLPIDLLNNIDQYLKLDFLTSIPKSTQLLSNVDLIDDEIIVESTAGFPDNYGLIKIDDEIILYKEKEDGKFKSCVRGFSGIDQKENSRNELIFKNSQSNSHLENSEVVNISGLFLGIFLEKIKSQISPGFENKQLYSEINQNLFLKQSSDFYSSKGSEESFKILFRSLYGNEIKFIRPQEYVFEPSSSKYRITKDLIVELIDGNIFDLKNRTIFQDEDLENGFDYASGSVSDVQILNTSNERYFLLKLDYDFDKDILVSRGSIIGDFSIHPKTRTIETTNVGSSIINVDSTLGFPNSGTLVYKTDLNEEIIIKYESKNYTQFLGCTGISAQIPDNSSIKINSYAYAYATKDLSEKIKFNISSIASSVKIPENNVLYEPNDLIEIETLGKEVVDDIRNSNLFYNISVSYLVESIETETPYFRIKTKDKNNLYPNDSVSLLFKNNAEYDFVVIDILDENTFLINIDLSLVSNISENLLYVRKKLQKLKANNFPQSSANLTDIQNTYYDEDDNLYIASSSLPNYSINLPSPVKLFSGSYEGYYLTISDHKFITGDYVEYIPGEGANKLNIDASFYYVKKVDNNTIQISNSKANLFLQKFINVSTSESSYTDSNGTTINGKVFNNKFVLKKYSNLQLENQKLIKQIPKSPSSDGKLYETKNYRSLGILNNGVEISNYFDGDSIFFGGLEEIIVTSGGNGYDVINPPTLTVLDSIGTGSSVTCEVEGSLDRIDIIDPGFDFYTNPTVKIKGGNGSGAEAKINLSIVENILSFNSSNVENIDLNKNTIGFGTFHRFRIGEKVIYDPSGQLSIGGITTSIYYISLENEFKIKLHENYSDSVLGINTINITSYGKGIHKIKSFSNKNKIGSISIVNRGSGYRTKKIIVPSSDVNAYLDSIYKKNHGYKYGEIVVYSHNSSPIEGLSNNKKYYVNPIDSDNFRLYEIGDSTNYERYYLDINQYIDLKSRGSGNHIFNYEPIEVIISGISSTTKRPIINPIFRGSIKNVFIDNPGTSYGSPDIINYNRQPSFNLDTGSGADLEPIVVNGKIEAIFIKNGGKNYYSTPDIAIFGEGEGAKVTPIIKNGIIDKVVVNYSGINYKKNSTYIVVNPTGKSAQFEAKIQKWNINQVEKLLQNGLITNDDGYIKDSKFGLQYCHLYSPRELRKLSYGKKFVSGKITYQKDLLLNSNGEELESDRHSPLLGFAYDGNPIYGPYGYANIDGTGGIKCLESGYKQINSYNQNRPNFPGGYFIEDYYYSGSGDLDIHNGRFCVTPEYPQGIYAYFTTIDSLPETSSQSPFKKYRKPVFPYIIGNSFKSTPIDVNFDLEINQDSFDPIKNNLIRNTNTYKFSSEDTFYKYIPNSSLNSNKQRGRIDYSSSGKIIGFNILNPGENYKVGDKLLISPNINSQISESILINTIKGKSVESIEYFSSSVENIQLYPISTNKFIGFSTVPHNLSSSDFISVNGLPKNILSQLKSDVFNVTVNNPTYILTTNLGSVLDTGSITYIKVQGDVSFPNLSVDDILKINSENVKVLSIDRKNSIIKIEREYNNTVGFSHSLSTTITQLPRKFDLNLNIDFFDSKVIDRTIYFNPEETVSIGLSHGPGIGNTLTIPLVSIGLTEVFAPTRTLYIENHSLNTGDKLVYSSNSGDPIKYSLDGINSFDFEENQEVFAVKINDNFVGLTTVKVVVGSGNTYIPIGTQSNYGLMYFSYEGTGNNHQFKTKFEDTLPVTISKNTLKVYTESEHNLLKSDTVDIKVSSNLVENHKIIYNDVNRRLILDPIIFDSSSVDVSKNTITLQNHGLTSGDKVICKTDTPIIGVNDDTIYFVSFVDNNTIKLCLTYLDSILDEPNEINLSSSSNGYIAKINPSINTYKNYKIIFDLSDSSLSSDYFGSKVSAFDFKLYSNKEKTVGFFNSSNDNKFNVSLYGQIGITSDARLELTIDDNTPENLYYSLDPINIEILQQSKLEYVTDSDNIRDNNKLIINNSLYNGKYNIVGVSQTSFEIPISFTPEKSKYTKTDSNITYTTNSSTAQGPINSLLLNSFNNFYKVNPIVKDIQTNNGYGAFLLPQTNSIGETKSILIDNISVEYPSDLTLRPTCIFPQILTIEPLYKIKDITVIEKGNGYNKIHDLIVIDNNDGKLNKKIKLTYDPEKLKVNIISNEQSLVGENPLIIPVNNSNGVGISSAVYNSETKSVTIQLDKEYSSIEDFPFEIGDKILVENVLNDGNNGFNSSDYFYNLFTISNLDANIGGFLPTLTYSLESYLGDDDVVGEYLPQLSFGRVVKSDDLPKFEITLSFIDYLIGEEVLINDSVSAEVISWNNFNKTLKVSSSKIIPTNEFLIGSTSGGISYINNNNYNKSEFLLGSSSIVDNNWVTEKGFLNNNYQRLHDNYYYQKFSYSINSNISYDEWGSTINELVHPAGFKEFSELSIESTPTIINSSCELLSGICTSQDNGSFEGVSDLTSVIDLDCYYDFDLAKEISYEISNQYVSNEIVFNSRILKDHFESIGNRVIEIQIPDDVSQTIGGIVRVSLLDEFSTKIKKYKKYIAYSQFNDDENIKQISLLSVAHNGTESFISEYGTLSTKNERVGYYDVDINFDIATLKFIPTDAANLSELDYTTTIVSYDINNNISGISTLNLGDIVKISGINDNLSLGSSGNKNIIKIPKNDYRSGKFIIGISSESNQFFQLNEVTFISDDYIGSNVEDEIQVRSVDYGKIVISDSNANGIGTYFSYYDSSDNTLNIDFVLNQTLGFDCDINVSSIIFSNYNSVSSGTTSINTGDLTSFYTKIPSTIGFSEVEIAKYNNEYQFGAYLVVTLENEFTNEHQISELVVLTDIENENASITEYGTIFVDDRLGYFSAEVDGQYTIIKYNVTKVTNLESRVFMTSIGIPNPEYLDNTEINLGNISISGSNIFSGGYSITFNRSFEIYNNNQPIFRRTFDGSDQNIVSIANSSIYLYEHNFTTGEKIDYYYDEGNEPIGIKTTNIVGIGTTDKLPSELYVVKRNKSVISLSATAEDALKPIPNLLSISSVGIGNSHTFMATKQTEKSLVAVDNVIQSPLSKTEYYTTLNGSITENQNIIRLAGIGSIFAGDLIKIESEYLLIDDVGIGTDLTLCRVRRDWMNTGIQTHFDGSEVRKYSGNYNIFKNFLTFVGDPISNVPVETDNPDEIDYSGIQTSSHFYGRIFFRSGVVGSANTAYSENYIFDDISSQFKTLNGNFLLTSNNNNVENVEDLNAVILIKDVFQIPQRLGAVDINGSYYIGGTGISTIFFNGTKTSQTYDINSFSVPVGGVIDSISSNSGLGYQPLVSAGGTAVIDPNGVLQSISIGSSGSGYRPIQEEQGINVYLYKDSEDFVQVGFANIADGHVYNVTISNPESGLDPNNPPLVVIDDPLPYSNIPLIYSSSSPNNGIGTEAKVSVTVSEDGAIKYFEFQNYGYSYDNLEILTVLTGGSYGIPINSSLPFEEFQITLTKVYNDKFSGWSMGEFVPLDYIDNLFNGQRTSFPLYFDGEIYPIVTRTGSNIDLKMTLLVFINNILQRPDVGYTFDSGSFITFAEPPKRGDKCEILFYKGTPNIDVVFNDIIETIEPGDNVTLNSDDIFYREDPRLVTQIKSIDSVITTPYSGPGISSIFNLERPVVWCKQRDDIVLSDQYLTKDRRSYESQIYPNASLISGVGIGSTHIFVDTLVPFFNNEKEGVSIEKSNSIEIVSIVDTKQAKVSAILNQSGTLIDFNIDDGGFGYSTPPIVTVETNPGIALSFRPVVQSVINDGVLVDILIFQTGIGFSTTPNVTVSLPDTKYESINDVKYEGDYGKIVGIYSTSITNVSNGLIFQLEVPTNSILRDESITGFKLEKSNLQKDYYFRVTNSNVGNGIISLDYDGNVVCESDTNIDNIYKVIDVYDLDNIITNNTTITLNEEYPSPTAIEESVELIIDDGYELTILDYDNLEVLVSVESYGSLISDVQSATVNDYYGDYSWGRIVATKRIKEKDFAFDFPNNINEIDSFSIVKRKFPLSSRLYKP